MFCEDGFAGRYGALGLNKGEGNGSAAAVLRARGRAAGLEGGILG
jgi:hypothetical protein